MNSLDTQVLSWILCLLSFLLIFQSRLQWSGRSRGLGLFCLLIRGLWLFVAGGGHCSDCGFLGLVVAQVLLGRELHSNTSLFCDKAKDLLDVRSGPDAPFVHETAH